MDANRIRELAEADYDVRIIVNSKTNEAALVIVDDSTPADTVVAAIWYTKQDLLDMADGCKAAAAKMDH